MIELHTAYGKTDTAVKTWPVAMLVYQRTKLSGHLFVALPRLFYVARRIGLVVPLIICALANTTVDGETVFPRSVSAEGRKALPLPASTAPFPHACKPTQERLRKSSFNSEPSALR